MKGRKRILYVLLAVSVLVPVTVTAFFPAMYVSAGSSAVVTGADTLGNAAVWNNPEDDVTVEDGTLRFPENSTEYTRFIYKSATKGDSYFADLVTMEYTVKFTRLPEGEAFIMAFGIPSIESVSGEPGSVEVAFSNDGEIRAGVTAYDSDGNAVTVAEPKRCGITLNKAAAIKAEISTDKKITVFVGGQKILEEKLPADGEGRVGFFQTGSCAAELTDLKVTTYQYDRPENMNITENFENGALDVSGLTSSMVNLSYYYPCGLSIQEYNGSNVFLFKNTGLAYIGTKYQYSNFEMTFDVPWLQVKAVLNEEGEIISPANTNFGVSFGGEKSEWENYGYKTATDMLVFQGGSTICSFNYPTELNGQAKEHPFTTADKPFSVKVRVVDGVVTASVKWVEDTAWEQVLSYGLDEGTPTGYIHLWATGPGNMAIDNLTITNLDENPRLLESKYESGLVTKPEDAEYEEFERIYAPEAEEKSVFWYWVIPMAAAAGGIALGITYAATHHKGKETKGNEE